jgi:protein N-terminal amidase
MRIATLQFAPKLGDVDGNIQRANELLKKGKSITLGDQTLPIGIGVDLMRPDVLVLPELALTGMYLTKICVDFLQSTDRVQVTTSPH